MKGQVVSHPPLKELNKAERHPVHNAAIDTMTEVHSVDVNEVGLGDFCRPEGFVARQVARWPKQYEASKTDELPSMDKLMKWLPENLPKKDQCAIAHGDYRLGNLMPHPDKPDVIAILDWELSTLGHPLAVVGWSIVQKVSKEFGV